VTLGEEKLRGVRQKLTVLHPKSAVAPPRHEHVFHDPAADGLSEAEQVILLHRDAKRQDFRSHTEKFVQ
jgi:adenylate cyclase